MRRAPPGVHPALRRAGAVHADGGHQRPGQRGATESTVFGPFFVDDSPEIALGGDLAQGAKGTPCWVSGQVRSTDGTPLAGVHVDAWEADEDGLYDTQSEGNRTAGRGWQITGENGEYRFWSVLPTGARPGRAVLSSPVSGEDAYAGGARGRGRDVEVGPSEVGLAGVAREADDPSRELFVAQ
ncbi:MAG TPA: hypothetical protein VGD71_33245 [Kribbella sp.]